CLGLLSKPMLVTLPFVFLLLDYWPLRRIRFIWSEKAKGKKAKGGNLEMEGAAVSRLIIEKLPMLALSLAAIVISSQSIHQHGDIISTGRVPMGLRVENAIVSYVLYLWKMVCPMNLTFYYPYPESIPGWQVVGAAIVLLLATAFILKNFFRAPYAFVGWLWFLGTLVPVSGIVQGGLWPAIAERWAYVPFIGLFITISWAVPDIVDRLGFRKRVLPFPAAAVLAVLAVLTWNQAGYWKDELAFYSRGVKINPNNFVAHGNLGVAYARLNRRQEAIPHFLTVVRHEPYDYTAWENLGEAYKKDKKTDQAIDCYLQALKYDPKPASVHYSLGELYADQGNLDKAAGEFTEVIRLKSRDAGAYYNLGVISAKKGNRAEAVRLLSSALKIKPHDADAHCALGVILVNENRIPEAVAHFKDVLQWDPGNREARDYLNAVLNRNAGKGTALPVIGQGSRNGDPKALYKEAVLFSSKGEYAKAPEALSKLREIQPDNPDVYYNIACIYAKQNRPEESVNWLKTSLEKGFKDWKLIAGDHDLDNIRQTEGYRRLMMQKKP
ncbi:MAG TPA: tetratricopeptide repeat protein, partial [Methanoregula sp.]|nr:tetratricopeptide repeat protein [Methanoregula sp.]